MMIPIISIGITIYILIGICISLLHLFVGFTCYKEQINRRFKRNGTINTVYMLCGGIVLWPFTIFYFLLFIILAILNKETK